VAAVSIAGLLHFGELAIESCEILNTGVSADGETIQQPAYGILGLLVLQCRIQGNHVTYAQTERDFEREDRALWLWGLFDFQATDLLTIGYTAQVLDNKFIGTGASALVQFTEVSLARNLFARFERVLFNHNHCWHWPGPPDDGKGTVELRGRRAIVMGNSIKALTQFFSINFNGIPGTFVGNATDHPPVQAGAVIPTPIGDFNL
jgi:hypothetical protein